MVSLELPSNGRYSAATTARGVAQPPKNRGGIPGYREAVEKCSVMVVV